MGGVDNGSNGTRWMDSSHIYLIGNNNVELFQYTRGLVRGGRGRGRRGRGYPATKDRTSQIHEHSHHSEHSHNSQG